MGNCGSLPLYFIFVAWAIGSVGYKTITKVTAQILRHCNFAKVGPTRQQAGAITQDVNNNILTN